jgi:predicted NUDIX family NTP pyrophosphohydrolase
MVQTSAGIVMYRRVASRHEVLLVHPGGPYWAQKDDGAWSIPKGLMEPGEDAEAAARREFEEETGFKPEGALADLGAFRQPSGKIVRAFALEGAFDPARLRSTTFEMEWPPKSGKLQRFPEVDRAAWFGETEALAKISKGQRPIVEAMVKGLSPR